MCCRFAYAIRYDFKALANVYNKRAGNVGYIDPLAASVECLKSFNVRWRGLK
jgi:hypothetical protein